MKITVSQINVMSNISKRLGLNSFVFFIFIFSPLFVFSQEHLNLEKILDKKEILNFWIADSLFNAREYEKALDYYTICDPVQIHDIGWPVKKALCFLLTNDTISAGNYMRKHIYNGGHYLYTDYIDQIPKLDVLINNNTVKNKFYTNTIHFQNSDSTCLFLQVKNVLMEMRMKDQNARLNNSNITKVDSLNRIKLDSLITIYGWLGYNEIGKSGENATFLIVQHSDLDIEFQEKCLNLLFFELKRKNISAQSFAMLYDRIQVNKSQKQLFGTQVKYNNELESFEPKPVYSKRLLNAYRLYFGLDNIASYIELMNKRN